MADSDSMRARRDLSRLLRPRSIAVFGGGWAGAVVEQCRRMGFDGEIWPLHPEKDEVQGLRCYRSLEELPGAPDVAFIGVNRTSTLEIVAGLRAMGAGGAVCFASGFAEAGPEGAALQVRLLEAAGPMPVIGPNCYGLINYLDGALLWPDLHGGSRVEHGVAIVTQSSNLAINLTMQRRGLPIAYMLTLGNQAMVGMADMIETLAEDPRVTAIGLHIEGIGDAGAFAGAVRAARRAGKPFVAMKSGSSARAADLALSHTASLAGGDAVADAFFRRLGVARLKSVPAFLETLKLLHLWGALPEASLVSLSCSGGEASIMADAAERLGVSTPPFSEAEAARIRPTVRPLVTLSNPFDYHTFDWGDLERLSETFTAAMGGSQAVTAVVLDFPREGLGDDGSWDVTVAALESAAQRTGRRAAVVASLPECLSEDRARAMLARGILPLMGIEEGLQAIAAAASIGPVPPEAGFDGLPAGKAKGGEIATWDEARAKTALSEAGLAVPESRLCRDVGAALAAAQDLGVVALKAVGANLAHKTEAGAVVLNLRGESEIRAAYARLSGLGEAVLVERMVARPLAELIVGLRRDPVLGLHLLIGAGGVLTELLADSAVLMLPAEEAEIEAALSALKVDALLRGWRGGPAADRPALIRAVRAIQAFGLANAARLEELEVNPLMVCETGQGAYVADALIRTREERE